MDTTPVEVPLWAVNQLEVLGHQCADAGKCHHACDKQLEKTCFRKECASPLSAATWLNLDWTLKEQVTA